MKQPDFDFIAKPYRWLEYLSLGPALQRCRTHFLPALCDQRNALILGDGDGRFLARLLAANPHLEASAVDSSEVMLQLLRHNCEAATPSAHQRLQTYQADARTFIPTGPYDLVVTHFFLDCLTQPELDALSHRIAPRTTPQALWLVSDFRIPTGPLRLPARLFVRGLYFAFRILTGLRTTSLPDHGETFSRAGLTLTARHNSLFGLLVTELWQLSDLSNNPTCADMPTPSPNSDPHTPPADPIPEPEPIAPSLDEPDPGVYHHDPKPPQ